MDYDHGGVLLCYAESGTACNLGLLLILLSVEIHALITLGPIWGWKKHMILSIKFEVYRDMKDVEKCTKWGG